MKIKKVKASNLPKANGEIIDSLEASVSEDVNAPSIRATREYIDGVSSVPTGSVIKYFGDTIPPGYEAVDEEDEDITDIKISVAALREEVVGMENTVSSHTSQISSNTSNISTLTNNQTRKTTIPRSITANANWYLALSGTLSGNDNHALTMAVQNNYSDNAGILNLNVRSDNGTLTLSKFKWLCNSGLSSSHFVVKISGAYYYMYVYIAAYKSLTIRILNEHTLDSNKDYNLCTLYNPVNTDTVSAPSGTYPGGTISYGTATPSGGVNGDIYFQYF